MKVFPENFRQCLRSNISDGKNVGGDVSATANVAVAGQDMAIKIAGKVAENSMAGTLSSPLGNIPFTAERD